MWYISTQIIMYVLFYVAYRLLHKKINRVGAVLFLNILFIAISIRMGKNEWTYETSLCFSLGVVLGEYRQVIQKMLNAVGERFFLLCIGLLSIVSMYYVLSHHVLSVVLVTVPLCMLLWTGLIYYIHFNSRLFHFLGEISYEIYIVQYTIITATRRLVNVEFLALIVSIMVSILIAWWIHKESNWLLNKWSQICSKYVGKRENGDI